MHLLLLINVLDSRLGSVLAQHTCRHAHFIICMAIKPLNFAIGKSGKEGAFTSSLYKKKKVPRLHFEKAIGLGIFLALFQFCPLLKEILIIPLVAPK